MIRLLFLLLLSTTLAAAAPGVKGSFKERNVGTFDLVDGIAYSGNFGTEVFATSKPIASAALTESVCVWTQARALTLLRNIGYIEAVWDAKGKQLAFEAGTPYGGRMKLLNPREWWIDGGKVKAGRVKGSVGYKPKGRFDFDLPVGKADTLRPITKDELLAAYREVRRATIAKDLPALLSAQGFSAKQIAAIRALPGIDADLKTHAERFLEPGDGEVESLEPARVEVKGKNPKGKAFVNFYWFDTCGDKLVLVDIGENPQ